MQWSEGDQWLLSLDLPAGSHEFKLVVVAPPAKEGACSYANWEAGTNRTLKVPEVEAASHGAFTVVCEWGHTESSLETLPSEELEEGEEALTESEEPALRPEDLGAEPYSPNGDEGEAPVGVIGKMTIERADEAQQPPAAAAPKPEAGQMGKRSDDTVSGVPAGGLKPSTEAAVKEGLRKSDLRKPGLLARFVQALTGSQQSEDEDEGGRGPPSGGSSGGSGAKGAEGGNQAQQQRGEQGPPPSSAAAAMQEPPSGMQLAIAAVGLAALPVVAWSEWVLKSTGCGLPPGPSGLLGAAEGVSYLVVGGVVLWSLASKLSTGRGLPAGPGGALGAVEGGSWLAALSGAVVLALQWQTYGYIPSALPDSNCFGQPAGFATAQAPSAPAAASLAAAPPLSGIDSSKAAATYGGPMRLAAGRSTSLPQGNLLFSLETALSQSGGIVQGAETAAAAVAAAAAGQPPPAQVAAAVQELKFRAMQAQQLVAALSSRAVGLGGEAGTDSALQAAAAEAAAAVAAPAPAEPLGFQPPRHRVRAALSASVDRMLHSEKLRAVLEPVPLPAVARQAAEAAGGALTAVDAAAKEAVELSLEAVQREEQLAAAWGKRAVGGAITKAQSEAEQLSGAAADAQSRLQAFMPQLRSVEQREEHPAATGVTAAVPSSRPSGSGSKAAADAPKPSSKAAAEAAQPDDSSGRSRKISGDVASIFGSVFSDLKEGYVGLWHSAQHFDAQRTMASLQERMAAGQAAQARAHAAAEAAAHGGSTKAAGEAAKAAAKQQVALKQPAGKRQSTVT
ncbi:T3A5_60 isoform B [Chlorella sorokiniana]|uniref:T3A5_60 isoform B n=1 Tax=Chlorella sorokiniana TaxID=3076 RepID=A0A2P6TY34_CHLSO|nr:T3A5_60 isoform B [Chlorella sorokiniana]|eukprot:PRW58979.1 T3A5_60 isoform B [Chlorella sorokiniana]